MFPGIPLFSNQVNGTHVFWRRCEPNIGVGTRQRNVGSCVCAAEFLISVPPARALPASGPCAFEKDLPNSNSVGRNVKSRGRKGMLKTFAPVLARAPAMIYFRVCLRERKPDEQGTQNRRGRQRQCRSHHLQRSFSAARRNHLRPEI